MINDIFGQPRESLTQEIENERPLSNALHPLPQTSADSNSLEALAATDITDVVYPPTESSSDSDTASRGSSLNDDVVSDSAVPQESSVTAPAPNKRNLLIATACLLVAIVLAIIFGELAGGPKNFDIEKSCDQAMIAFSCIGGVFFAGSLYLAKRLHAQLNESQKMTVEIRKDVSGDL